MKWSLYNIMREDPLRRFTFGITVEGTHMRFWCSNRAFLAVSLPINFVTEIDNVISLFYLIGSKTKVELGWDPTVERICDRVPDRYKFTIGNQQFTTTRPLATYGADTMVGRGTRVYEAQDENGNIVAIKDSWRVEDCEPEGAILEKILEDIRDKLGENKVTEAERYFVRVRVYEDVAVSGKTDKTLILENEEDVEWITIDADPWLSNSCRTSRAGRIPDSGCYKILCRIHTRTVFWDIGIPVTDVPLLADSFSCLSDARRALYYLHKAGWVHRDFSVGNVLWVGRDDHGGKLTDFEFAKKVDSELSDDIRTGTMQFMAIEVESQAFLFVPDDLNVPLKLEDLTFRVNFLHDLESLWWAAMWVLLYNTDEDQPAGETQLDWFNEAFPPSIMSASRHLFFTLSRHPVAAYRSLSNTYRDQSEPVIRLARSLRDHYKEAEKSSPPSPETVLEPAHKTVSDAFSVVAERLKGSNIRLRPRGPWITVRLLSRRKRKRG
ncbi:hypothetical protein HD554DRAFT_1444130 [Boletus coccyginus]|nr:hypothetical protein HD554DRAFT_1444130 [Boletus coccyginus]